MGPFADRDIIVADETFRAEGKRAKEISENSETTITKVVDILMEVCEAELTEGNTAENFKTYTESVSQLKGQLGQILEDQSTNIEKFITEIVEADNYFYPEKEGGTGAAYWVEI